MLNRAEVEEAARRHGLGEHAVRLADRVRPGWALEPIGGMQGPPGATKIGGHPDLAPHEDWPRNERGIAMTFLGQIDTSTIPSWGVWKDDRPWNHGGELVRVFADLVDCPYEPGLAMALSCDPSGGVRRMVAPPVPEPFPAGGPWDRLATEERLRVLPEAPVSLAPLLTAPDTDPFLRADENDHSGDADAYIEWAMGLREAWPRLHHLLGEPTGIQGDPLPMGPWVWAFEHGNETLTDPTEWRSLLGLHNDPQIGLHILDGGSLNVLAPVADLAAGRYDRLVCDVDSC